MSNCSDSVIDNTDVILASDVLQDQLILDGEDTTEENYLTEKLPISDLEKDFSNHAVYLDKLESLKQSYRYMRRVRRDGSCFYRAYGFALLENLLNLSAEKDEGEKSPREVEASRLKILCEKHRKYLVDEANYPDFTVSDFCENFVELINGVADGLIDQFGLLERFNNREYSNFYVSFLRLLVSAYLQENAEYYCHFVDTSNGGSLKEFCSQQVEPMPQEADNIQLLALALALDSPIRIANIQLHGPLQVLNLPEESLVSAKASAEDAKHGELPQNKRFVELLYRPGHYDILYV